jgi:hypothetical protein
MPDRPTHSQVSGPALRGAARDQQVATALSRNGGFLFAVSNGDRENWLSTTSNLRCRVEARIAAVPGLRRCFKPDEGAIKFRNGHPETNQTRLRDWLRSRWVDLREGHDYPIPWPEGTEPDNWEFAAQCDSQIALWVEYEYLCAAERSLRRLNAGLSRLTWEITPRLRLKPSWWRIVAGRNPLRAPDGHALVVIELPDLETRCLFALCHKEFWDTKYPALPDFADWNQHVADQLGLAGASSTQVAAALISGSGMLLSDRALEGLVSHRAKTESSRVDLRILRNELVKRFPELDRYECRSVADFRNAFGLESRSRLIQPSDRNRAYELHMAASTGEVARISKAFSGELGYYQWERVKKLDLANIDSTQRADGLLAVDRQSISGRSHGTCRISDKSVEFLDLADEFRKYLLSDLHAIVGDFIAWDDQLVGVMPNRFCQPDVEAALQMTIANRGRAFFGNAPAVKITWPEWWKKIRHISLTCNDAALKFENRVRNVSDGTRPSERAFHSVAISLWHSA